MSHPALLTPEEVRLLAQVDQLAEEMFDFLAHLIRIPTVNPPGEHYAECAAFVGERLVGFGYEVTHLAVLESPAHDARAPRVNVVGRFARCGPGRTVHVNAHMDVAPVGEGWTVEPFAGIIREGRIFGRGAADAKAGFAAGLYAVEALRRAHIAFDGAIEVSATADGESGGAAGVGHLVDMGVVRAGRTDAVIIAAASGVERLRCDPQSGHLSEDVATARGGLATVTSAEVFKKMRIVRALDRAIRVVLVRAPEYVVGPAVPDCAHIRRSGVEECLLYGPGRFEYARRPDEQCRLDDVVAGCKVLALALLWMLREDAEDSPARIFRVGGSH
ncbi:N-formyl-4-amino-5-aminomethyl-2-methylpyrimidine deformylase [bacterium HR10]|nr:N-formyl-4-amino-5-aminomethyl-2-methylpyrimidine deformylase [bacterium HR10]